MSESLSDSRLLLCRNLHLEVDGSWEKVENFTPFTAKDMAEMRKHILCSKRSKVFYLLPRCV